MLLSVQNVCKNFGSVSAVKSVTFDVEQGAMIGIIGRSGAGKSTFLRMINRLVDASSGRILFKGRNILAYQGAEMRRWQANCAMIFQQFNLVPRMDVVSNVLHGTLNRRSTLATAFNLFPRADIEKASSFWSGWVLRSRPPSALKHSVVANSNVSLLPVP